MAVRDRSRLGRALQMARGLHWGFGANGDPYSMILSSRDDDPWSWYEKVRAAGPGPFASRAGAWVVSDHPTATKVLADPAFTLGPASTPVWMRAAGCPATLWAGPFQDFQARSKNWAGAPVDADWLERQCTQLLAELGTRFDLVHDFAGEVPVLALGTMPELKGVAADRLRAWAAATRVCLDAQLSPQQLAVTEEALAALGEIETVTGSQDAPVLVAVAAEMAANLVSNAVLTVSEQPELAARLADDPASAERIVTEVSRTSPPVHLERRTAGKDCTLGGAEVTADDEVIVVLAAANRDPDVFTDPDRFDADRADTGGILLSQHGSAGKQLDELVLMLATAALRAAAPALPRLSRSGPVVRRRRSPVARGLSRCVVELRGE